MDLWSSNLIEDRSCPHKSHVQNIDLLNWEKEVFASQAFFDEVG